MRKNVEKLLKMMKELRKTPEKCTGKNTANCKTMTNYETLQKVCGKMRKTATNYEKTTENSGKCLEKILKTSQIYEKLEKTVEFVPNNYEQLRKNTKHYGTLQKLPAKNTKISKARRKNY